MSDADEHLEGVENGFESGTDDEDDFGGIFRRTILQRQAEDAAGIFAERGVSEHADECEGGDGKDHRSQKDRVISAGLVRHGTFDIQRGCDSSKSRRQRRQSDHGMKWISPQLDFSVTVRFFFPESQLSEDDDDTGEHEKIRDDAKFGKKVGSLQHADEERNTHADHDANEVFDARDFVEVLAGERGVSHATEPLAHEDDAFDDPRSDWADCAIAHLPERHETLSIGEVVLDAKKTDNGAVLEDGDEESCDGAND